MKAHTLKNRIEKRFTGSKNSFAYKVLVDLTNGTNTTGAIKNGVIRPCHTSGSGRFTGNLDYTKAVQHALTVTGLKFEAGNDSPRGGKPGNFIRLKSKIEI